MGGFTVPLEDLSAGILQAHLISPIKNNYEQQEDRVGDNSGHDRP